MSDRVLQVDVRRGVATLTLDSPANRNALSRAMRAQLRSALTEAIADDSVRVVVLDHTGRVFCSGMDLAEAAGGAAEDQDRKSTRLNSSHADISTLPLHDALPIWFGAGSPP